MEKDSAKFMAACLELGIEDEHQATAALFSIAISLKRIADEFDGHGERLGMSDMMHGIMEGTNRG